jgi:hypothetical protein
MEIIFINFLTNLNGFWGFYHDPNVGWGGFNSPWPTLCILLILDCQKNLILKIKLPDPIMKILTILTKTAEC